MSVHTYGNTSSGNCWHWKQAHRGVYTVPTQVQRPDMFSIRGPLREAEMGCGSWWGKDTDSWNPKKTFIIIIMFWFMLLLILGFFPLLWWLLLLLLLFLFKFTGFFQNTFYYFMYFYFYFGFLLFCVFVIVVVLVLFVVVVV